MRRLTRTSIAIAFSATLVCQSAQAWQEGGHHLITRAAVNLLASYNTIEMSKPFEERKYMLAHLANIPDIGWKGIGRDIAAIGDPTHFFQVDDFSSNPDWSSLPRSMGDFYAMHQAYCKAEPTSIPCQLSERSADKASIIGTAPWRVQQFGRGFIESLAGLSDTDHFKNEKQINEALLNAGLLSHFLGDLANPHHVTANYDGRYTGQGGLHSYFEGQIVEALGSRLEGLVYEYALKEKPFEKLQASIPADRNKNDPFTISLALSLNSFQALPTLLELDEKFSLIKKGSKPGESPSVHAQRKPAREVADNYEKFVVERLALAADTLANVWYILWEQAKNPDMKDFRSLHSNLSPRFIYPDYLP